MQVGSKVKYVKHFPFEMLANMLLSGWNIREFPQLEQVYTIRHLFRCTNCKHIHILVEELVIGETPNGTEICTFEFQWREVEPPTENVGEWVDKLIETIPEPIVKEREPAMA